MKERERSSLCFVAFDINAFDVVVEWVACHDIAKDYHGLFCVKASGPTSYPTSVPALE